MPPPGLGLLALEFRAPWEFTAVLPAWPALLRAPTGDGHPVVVFPGLSASDASTAPLRGYLGTIGYQPQGWNQGFNFGPRAGVLDAARRHIQARCDATGRKVSLIGWSLGGVYARELAKEMPESVRCVITLGTPFAGPPKSTNAWRIYELTSGRNIDREAERFQLHEAPPVPTTACLIWVAEYSLTGSRALTAATMALPLAWPSFRAESALRAMKTRSMANSSGLNWVMISLTPS